MTDLQDERIFVISPYFPDSDGNLIPEIPDKCPHHFHDDRKCKVHKDHDRERKTGPSLRFGSWDAEHMV